MFKKQIVFPKNLGSGSLFSSVTHLQELVCGAVYDVVTKPSFWMRRPSALASGSKTTQLYKSKCVCVQVEILPHSKVTQGCMHFHKLA